MEKRFFIFLLVSFLIVTGNMLLMSWLRPPQPVAKQEAGDAAAPPVDEQPNDQRPPDGVPPQLDNGDDPEKVDPDKPVDPAPAVDPNNPALPADGSSEPSVALVENPPQRLTLGSADPKSPYRMLVTFERRGAAVERVELNSPRYQDLDEEFGYLGHLGLILRGGKVTVTVVGPGTPAAVAKADEAEDVVGLRPGDVIREMNGVEIDSVKLADGLSSYEAQLQKTKPGRDLKLTIERTDGQQQQTLHFTVRLRRRPMDVIRPEFDESDPAKQHPLSYLLTVGQMTGSGAGLQSFAGPAALRNANWEIVKDSPPDEVAFYMQLPGGEQDQVGPLEVIKRYRLAKIDPADIGKDGTPKPADEATAPSYHLTLTVEIHNRSDKSRPYTIRMDGATGLPLEGWWYMIKIHPEMRATAGVRDVALKATPKAHTLYGCTRLVDYAEDNPSDPRLQLIAAGTPTRLDYAGVDAQYFNSSLLPEPGDDPAKFDLVSAYAMPVGEITDPTKKTDVSFQLLFNTLQEVPAGGKYQQSFRIFVGPKEPKVLEYYGLQDMLVYGWFAWVAKPMLDVLHFFYNHLVFNYGLAIILLTVMVRGCLFPLGRKQAMNAQKMQELAPEMAKIKERYKDMEKRSKAQQELFKKHNYNPLGGCGLMFLQLPIFIGLYRSLSVDINLRGASLIPGINWCSNLAGPDMLWYWKPDMPGFLQFLVNETGWLGPYLNVLPLVTVVLFYITQKLFTPPPTDEQSRMQQQVMSFMTLFIGLLFFKVPAGLCLYFIASSLWGISERKLLPRSKPIEATPSTGNGGTNANANRPKSPRGSGANNSGKRPRRPKR